MFIIRNGEKFHLTKAEVLQAYNEQLDTYREEDAQRHFLNYVFGSSEGAEDYINDNLDAFEIEACYQFEEKHGPLASFLQGGENCIIDDIVDIYDGNFDCNIAENDAYEMAIKEALSGVKKIA